MKILLVNEASFLSSGYSIYGRELLSELQKMGHEVAELGAYAMEGDPRLNSIPWKIYPNLPANDEERRIYDSNTQNVFGKFRFENTLLNYEPTHVCVTPKSLVFCERGYIPIKDVTTEDKVYTHKGVFQKVKETMSRDYDGELIKIHYNGYSKPLSVTPNHPVYILRNKKQTNQKKSIKKIYSGIEPIFVPAKDIKEGDMIVFPSQKTLKNNFNTIIDVGNYLDSFYSTKGDMIGNRANNGIETSKPIKRKIRLNRDFGRLIGFLITDGCIHNNGISATFHSEEIRFAKEFSQCTEKVFGHKSKIYKYKNKNSVIVQLNSVTAACFLRKYIGWSKTKTVPVDTWYSNQYFIEGILEGAIKGDGSYSHNSVRIHSSRKYLSNIFRVLNTYIKICTTVNSRFPTNDIMLEKKIKTIQETFCIEAHGKYANKLHSIVKKFDSVEGTKTKYCRNPFTVHNIDDKYLISKINKIETKYYKGKVYNLSVENDESYCVEQACVHNCSLRDNWMDSYIYTSPFRDFYSYVAMPTVDAYPQKTDWIEDYSTADAILTYQDWSGNLLKNACDKINHIGSAPSIPPSCMKPSNKRKARESLCLPEGRIFGTVMRNQKRKLFPDLFDVFSKYLKETGDNAYLYCHTTYPDNGWALPELLEQFNVGNRVLFTYKCKNCNYVECMNFYGIGSSCPRCRLKAMFMPDVQNGIPPEIMSVVYNSFDLYIQYANSEGLGMGQLEAAACGVPVVSVDYSGMKDVVKKLDGYRVTPLALVKELETGCYRACPDNSELLHILKTFANLPEIEVVKLQQSVHNNYRENYSREKTVMTWDNAINNTRSKRSWNDPNYDIMPVFDFQELPQLSNSEYVDWLFQLIPKRRYSSMYLRMIRDLENGFSIENMWGGYENENAFQYSRNNFVKFDRQKAYETCARIRDGINYWEGKRQEKYGR